MKLNSAHWLAFSALGVAIASMFFQRKQVQLMSGASPAGGVSVVNGAPSFNFGSRGTVGGMPSMPGYTGSSCGCGGSFGDYAVPELLPIFGDTQKVLPFTRPPVINDPQLNNVGNGAAI